MNDRNKTCLSAFLLGSTFVLPLVGLAVGWVNWDLKTGAMIGLGVFAVLFLLSGILLAAINGAMIQRGVSGCLRIHRVKEKMAPAARTAASSKGPGSKSGSSA